MITYGNNDVIVMQIIITMALMISLAVGVPNNETRRDAFYHVCDATRHGIVIFVESNRFVAPAASIAKSLGKRRVLRLPCVHDSLKYMNIVTDY